VKFNAAKEIARAVAYSCRRSLVQHDLKRGEEQAPGGPLADRKAREARPQVPPE
jgi:hypothetical protein